MSLTRRRFLKSGAASAAGMWLGSTFDLRPAFALGNGVITVSFSGTGCTRDEGEVTRLESDKDIYLPSAGYIPVRINKELGGYTSPSTGSSSLGQTVRGVGENDWATPRDNSEALHVNGPLDISQSSGLASYISSYVSGNQYADPSWGTGEQVYGYSMPALALHAANIVAETLNVGTYNFIGHSRGGVEAIMAAWFLYAYGSPSVRDTPVNIFAIDPVPGMGEWYSTFTQLPPNVAHYVGVYAWDHGNHPAHPTEHGFQALVPRPNHQMRGETNSVALPTSRPWWSMANGFQQLDPLAPAPGAPQPTGYDLYACRGRHSTVAGNTTSDSDYFANRASARVAPVPALIYKMARGYLTSWGTTFTTPCAVPEGVSELRQRIHRDHRDFDTMGGGETRNSVVADRPFVRRISSIYGSAPWNTYFMDDVVGDPPYKLAFPVTKHRTNAGWVKWKFL